MTTAWNANGLMSSVMSRGLRATGTGAGRRTSKARSGTGAFSFLLRNGLMMHGTAANGGNMRRGAGMLLSAPPCRSADPTPALACIAADSLVVTLRGPIPAGALRSSDRVLTRDNGWAPVHLVARATVRPGLDAAAVRISEGLFGNDRPLLLSSRQRVLLRDEGLVNRHGTAEFLVEAGHLVNADTVRSMTGPAPDYVSVVLDGHDLILADGVWTESFHPDKTRLAAMDQDSRASLLALFPTLAFSAVASAPVRPVLMPGDEARLLPGRDAA